MSLYLCLVKSRISGMSKRSILFLVIFFVLVFVSEQAPSRRQPSKIPVRDGSGELPTDLFENDKNLRKVPPFRDPVLADDDFNEYSFETRVNGRRTPPPDFEYRGPEDSDYGNDFGKPGRKPEISPDLEKDGYPNIKDEDNDIHRKVDEEARPYQPGNEDYDKPRDGEIDYSLEDKDSKIPTDEEDEEKRGKGVDESHDDGHNFNDVPMDGEEEKHDKDADESHDDDHDSTDVSKDDEEEKDDKDEDESHDDDHDSTDVSKDDEEEKDDKDADESHDDDHDSTDEDDEGKHDKNADESHDDDHGVVYVTKDDDDEVPDKDNPEAGGFYDGIIFDTPFFNVRQVTKYFQQLEKALEQVFRQSMDEATLLNGTYANTTEEEVEIKGKKYLIQKSIIKGKDNNSSIYVEALSTVPKTNETEELKDSGL